MITTMRMCWFDERGVYRTKEIPWWEIYARKEDEMNQDQQGLNATNQCCEVSLPKQLQRAQEREKSAYARMAEIEAKADLNIRAAALDAAIRTPELLTTANYVERAEAFYAFLAPQSVGPKMI